MCPESDYEMFVLFVCLWLVCSSLLVLRVVADRCGTVCQKREHRDICIDTAAQRPRYIGTRTKAKAQRHRDTETERQRDTQTQRHRDTEAHRHTQTHSQLDNTDSLSVVLQCGIRILFGVSHFLNKLLPGRVTHSLRKCSLVLLSPEGSRFSLERTAEPIEATDRCINGCLRCTHVHNQLVRRISGGAFTRVLELFTLTHVQTLTLDTASSEL